MTPAKIDFHKRHLRSSLATPIGLVISTTHATHPLSLSLTFPSFPLDSLIPPPDPLPSPFTPSLLRRRAEAAATSDVEVRGD